ncbi:MAG: hypothetical protein KME60_28560 [Cyanomargarita calcarea GSE-NOS-MK-12-04C]|jgi:hypothetical protein|uniref:Uncharacterized protein n=1 Tax=Cyanomargarita calcarea GSE-NOS-MK-12-04C TaxID=2839659 RepID=A0A951UZ07_9CYAN|nr:hypothetical protein [Cyanomargarita calcarea GSE-NOS-MK-12-04C]
MFNEGRRKKEEGRRKKEEGRRKKEEGRRKKEGGRSLQASGLRVPYQSTIWRSVEVAGLNRPPIA